MQQISFREIVNTNSNSICDCLIKKGMNLEEALDLICKSYLPVRKALELDQVKFKDLGINITCALTYKNLLTEIINALIQKDIDILKSFEVLIQTVNSIIDAAASYKDEKVKLSAASSEAKYLSDYISTLQPGTITNVEDKLVFIGFVPIGTVMMINKSRLPDFETNGKGKINTDVYGYAICNGNNGTINRLGKMVKFATDVSDAGKSGGADTFTIADTNIPSLAMGVTGTISDALVTPVKTKTSYYINIINDGAGGTEKLLRWTADGNGTNEVLSKALDLRHGHSFNLSASRTNTNPTPIDILPSHILEIPIERITL